MDNCMWCDMPAVRCCDAVIGLEPKGAVRNGAGNVISLLAGLDGVQWTCDAPMCADHARQVGWICGSEPDSIDHCPHHATHGEADMSDLLMFQSEAEARRRDIYAEIRRWRIRVRSNAEALPRSRSAAK